MNEKKIVLNDRDMQVFAFINKYRVAATKSISLACGFNSIQYVSRRISKLTSYGYVKQHSMYYGYPYFYSLTTKGLREIGIDAKAYKPSRTTALHYVGVADIAALLARRYSLDAVNDFYVDKDFRHNEEVKERYQLETSHKPDVIFVKDDEVYYVEYERSYKGKKRVMENLLMNHLSSALQIWVIDGLKFEKIKAECADDIHFADTVKFIEYPDVVTELKELGGVKIE